ncbi:MAG: L-lactate permease [Anaerolineae bacterium]
MSISPATWFLALSPILVVLALMVGFRWGGAKAGPVGWLVALVVAGFLFGAGPRLLFYSQIKGLLLALFVLYIVWFALALYHVVDEAGALEVISAGVARLTADRTMQLLILSWVFASFLQGVTGFGVPIAVVAPLLISLGFPAVTSVVAASVGHSWAVTFGSVASSFYAMLAVTGLDGPTLAPWSAIMLGIACFPCGLVPAYLHQGWSSLRHSLPAVLSVGIVMAVVQYLMATNGLWNLASFVAGLIGLIVVAGLARLPMYQGTLDERTANRRQANNPASPMSLPVALSAYLVLLVLIVIAQLVPPVHDLLNRIKIVVNFPQTQTALGWVNEAGTYRTISVFGHAGAVLIYTCIISYFIYRRLGHHTPGAPRRIAVKTVQGSVKSTTGIVSLVGMALFMADSGMTFTLAQGLSRTVGSAFPFIVPFIGALGAFMTGSNTNSNVVFAQLQQTTAQALGLNLSDVLIILGAQNVGGAIGSMFAPAKVIVGCSTAGLAGQEGDVLRQNLIYGLLIVALTGVLIVGLIGFF